MKARLGFEIWEVLGALSSFYLAAQKFRDTFNWLTLVLVHNRGVAHPQLAEGVAGDVTDMHASAF